MSPRGSSRRRSRQSSARASSRFVDVNGRSHGFRDAQRAQGRGRSVRGDRGPAHESSGARASPRPGFLIQGAEADDAVQVLVFESADRDYFISHVDVTRIGEYREAAAKLAGDASIGLLFRRLSVSRLVTIAQIEGRVRAAGSEFVLACDMRFAARESAIFSQPEPAFSLIPGAGGVQHLTRLLGRARALEVILSAEDYDAELAERYGWINRALPASALGEFVRSLAHRIAAFPAGGRVAVKDRVNAIALAPAEDFRRDSDLFGEGVRKPEAQGRIQAAMKRGFQTRDAEMDLARMLGDLPDH
ncbi:MAG: enoyl-CoA hydratase [Acidobacteria bacterium]|nr:MAG: enoyl-CoA hydratase [Acidobacteriota bacterium]